MLDGTPDSVTLQRIIFSVGRKFDGWHNGFRAYFSYGTDTVVQVEVGHRSMRILDMTLKTPPFMLQLRVTGSGPCLWPQSNYLSIRWPCLLIFYMHFKYVF